MPIENNFAATQGRVLRRNDNTTVTFGDDAQNSDKVTIPTEAFDEMFGRFVAEKQENLGAEVQEQFDAIFGDLQQAINGAFQVAGEQVSALRKELGIRTRRSGASAGADTEAAAGGSEASVGPEDIEPEEKKAKAKA